MSDFLSVFITTPSRDEAEKIARALVEEKLAACVNIMPGVESLYRWQGKIEKNQECALIAKTSSAIFDALQKRVKELHSYHCPCITAWPIVKGNEEYLKWLGNDL